MEGLTKRVVFKQDYKGTKDGRAYRFIELHDPKTLDNIRFFIDQGATIQTNMFRTGDQVDAQLTVEFQFGRPRVKLVGLGKPQQQGVK